MNSQNAFTLSRRQYQHFSPALLKQIVNLKKKLFLIVNITKKLFSEKNIMIFK